MKKCAFLLVETIIVISILVVVSLLIGNLLISSLKISDNAAKKYKFESSKNSTIMLLYGDSFDAYNITHCSMNYTEKFTVMYNLPGQKGFKTYDIIWKK